MVKLINSNTANIHLESTLNFLLAALKRLHLLNEVLPRQEDVHLDVLGVVLVPLHMWEEQATHLLRRLECHLESVPKLRDLEAFSENFGYLLVAVDYHQPHVLDGRITDVGIHLLY